MVVEFEEHQRPNVSCLEPSYLTFHHGDIYELEFFCRRDFATFEGLFDRVFSSMM